MRNTNKLLNCIDMKKYLMIAVLLISAISSIKAEKPTKWYKGNTHSHSTVSDGDSPAYKVVQKYHDKGYNFLLITDHNFLVNPDTIKKPEYRKDPPWKRNLPCKLLAGT